MSRRKWATVPRYQDGLVDIENRGVVTDRGIAWVCDRFVLVRADMFSLHVTERGWIADTIRPAQIRSILDARPVVGKAIYGGLADASLGLVGDEEQSAVAVRFNGTASLVASNLKPLLDACDLLRLKDGIVYGYQRRPHSEAPVLVAVVQTIPWSSHFLKQVES